MGSSLTHKILKEHLLSGELIPGREIAIKIDQTLTQDATGTMAYLQFESMGIPRVKSELSVSYVDHNTLQMGFENADDHRYLQTVAARYGVVFSRPGNGICHQVHLERFAAPGRTLLGSDSHTPTAGGMGMIAIGSGGLDVAVAMAGGEFYLTAPQVIKIELKGRLRKWVSAKDVIFYVLSVLSTKGNVNKVLEYAGDGVKTLSIPERATITNMGAETGVTTSIFPSDEITKAFLTAQDRKKDWRLMEADEGADYAQIINIDLSKLLPMAALPHSPGNVVPVKDICGRKVDQVEIGSCTNSSLRDLMVVGKLIAGKKVHPRVSLAIAPGSRQVFSMISKNGILSHMIDSGARIMESTCGFCIGSGQSPHTDAVSVRTSNRNFEGRSGTQSAGVYLVSPETAALAAIYGEFVDPLSMNEKDFPCVDLPERFDVDDSMIIYPPENAQGVKIIRGPNIGEPPVNSALAAHLEGVIAIKVGDKITTDHIMPAGPRLKYRSNIKKYAEFVFEGVEPKFFAYAAKLRAAKKAVFILAGESYGQGSSREHAALCPMFLGVKAVFAKSLERIHAANLVNFGILPLLFVDTSDYDKVDKDDEIRLTDVISCLDNNKNIILYDATKKISLEMKYLLSSRQKEIVKSGGLLNYTRGK
ncbi:MAG: aconitate hydratase [Candidatus Omnitrophica bacterium]|nr:aconitate hydratase [Candidatus Omnitrophota bacterium]MBU4478468.1 aconitate hydratase [Candidatus Omnitrophota bacterium]MCG2703769.1 aconitate hydratase [Candidatus Omnitrophota bacterium]